MNKLDVKIQSPKNRVISLLCFFKLYLYVFGCFLIRYFESVIQGCFHAMMDL